MRLVSLHEEILFAIAGAVENLHTRGNSRPSRYNDLISYLREGGDPAPFRAALSGAAGTVFQRSGAASTVFQRISNNLADIALAQSHKNSLAGLQAILFDNLGAFCNLVQVCAYHDNLLGFMDRDRSLTAEILLVGATSTSKDKCRGAIVLDALVEQAVPRAPKTTYAPLWAERYADMYNAMTGIEGLNELAKPFHVREVIREAGNSNSLLFACSIGAARANDGLPRGIDPELIAAVAIPYMGEFLYTQAIGQSVRYGHKGSARDTVLTLIYDIERDLVNGNLSEKIEAVRLLGALNQTLFGGLTDSPSTWSGIVQDRAAFDECVTKFFGWHPELVKNFGELMPERIQGLLGIKTGKTAEPLFNGWEYNHGIIFAPCTATYVEDEPQPLPQLVIDYFEKFGETALTRLYAPRKPVEHQTYVYKKPSKDSVGPEPG